MAKTSINALLLWALCLVSHAGPIFFGLNQGAAAVAGNTAVTSYGPVGTLQSTLDGKIGFRFVPDANMTITHLGRWKIAGNAASHVLEIYIDGSGTPLASATITSGGTAGQFNYIALGTPLSISAGSTYYIMSTEANGGDQWYGDDGTATFNAHFSSIKPFYIPSGGSFTPDTPVNATYGPVDFKFTIP